MDIEMLAPLIVFPVCYLAIGIYAIVLWLKNNKKREE